MRSILGFCGSLRQDSYNRRLLRLAQEYLEDRTLFEIVDISQIPLYNEDVRQAGLPANIVEVRTRIARCHGLVFATPEYNHSIPGVLKNTIDWISRPPEQPFQGKIAAILGGGGRSGTQNSQIHLKQVLQALKVTVIPSPEVVIAQVWDKWDQGRLLDPKVNENIAALMETFVNALE